MNYQEFKARYINNLIDYDKAYGGQCFDVVNQYIFDITGANPYIRLLKASDIWYKPHDIIPEGVNYQKISNTIDFVPQQGDIVIWDQAGWNGGYGHAGIIDSSDLNTGIVLQQNGFNPQEGCRLVQWNWYTYNFIGVIRLTEQKPELNIRTEGNLKQYRVMRGGWRSQVIEELINAGLYHGIWQDNQAKFDRLNPFTPLGGWAAESWVNYDEIIQITPITIEPAPAPITIEPAPTPIMVEPETEKFDFNKFFIGFAKVNADKAAFSASIGAFLVAANQYYQLGLNDASIAQYAGLISVFLVVGGVSGQIIKRQLEYGDNN